MQATLRSPGGEPCSSRQRLKDRRAARNPFAAAYLAVLSCTGAWIEGRTLLVLISAQRKYRARACYKIQRQNLKYGGNEAMTKQRIGVLAVCLLLAAAGMGQTPPAKQMA